jgi:hypothetical protein
VVITGVGGSSFSATHEPNTGDAADASARVRSLANLWLSGTEDLTTALTAAATHAFEITPSFLANGNLRLYFTWDHANLGAANPLVNFWCGSTAGKRQGLLLGDASGVFRQTIGAGSNGEAFFDITPDPIEPRGIGSLGGMRVLIPEEAPDQRYAGVPADGDALSFKVPVESSGGSESTSTFLVADVIAIGAYGGYWLLGTTIHSDIQGIYHLGTENVLGITEATQALTYEQAALTAGDVWLRVLQSSGSGTRGAEDEFSFGWGAGIPSAWLDFVNTDFPEAHPMRLLITAGDSEAESLLLQALSGGLAFTQTLDGVLPVPIRRPSDITADYTLGAADILLGGVAVRKVESGPNVVVIERGAGLPDVIFKDRVRVALDGEANVRTFKVHPCYDMEALAPLISTILDEIGNGQNAYIYEIPVTAAAAWQVENGDVVEISGGQYWWADLGTGQHRATSLYGRCIGVQRKLDGSGGVLKVLVHPTLAGNYYSCDTGIVGVNIGLKQLTVDAGTGAQFADTEKGRIYRPGEEDTKLETETINTVAGDVLTLAAVPGGFVVAIGDRIAFAEAAVASTRQNRYAHVDDDGVLP